MIKNILFDIGLVLIDWNREYLFKPYFNDDDKCRFFLDNVCTLEWNFGNDDGTSYAYNMEKLIKQYPEWEDAIRTYKARWIETIGGQVDGMEEILRELKSLGYKMYGLTNWSFETFYQITDKYPILGLLDGVVVSADVGLMKPSVEFFNYSLEKFNIKAEECVFTDDTLANVEGCRKAGIDAIHFKGAQDYRAQLFERGILN